MIEYFPFELHTHTIHSDGSYSEAELVDRVKQQGLYGFSLTDHNTQSGCMLTKNLAGENNLLFLPGLEWTTFYGHITVISTQGFHDYRDINPLTIEPILKKTKEKGGLSFLAHPFRVGSPVCTGCNDEFGLLDYSVFHGFEVWSGPNPDINFSNTLAEKKYDSICVDGAKLAVVYGKDWHRDSKEKDVFAATYVGIEGGLTNESFFEGLKKKRTYISLGLHVVAKLKNSKGEFFHLGSTISPGDYVLSIKISPDKSKAHKEGYIAPTHVELQGSSLQEKAVAPLCEENYTREISLNKGYLKIRILGTIEGRKTTLSITTPFFVSD